jgi:hypothetical protein
MNTRARAASVGLVTAVLCLSLGCQCGWLIPWPPPDPLCAEAPYSPPPEGFDESDLVGTWQTQYGRSVDTLTVMADGTFKQRYEDRYDESYVFETSPNAWWLERFPDGRIRLHLQGARYYIRGITVAELGGYALGSASLDGDSTPGPTAFPHPFYDPFGRESLHMVGELILTVRVDSRGEPLLHHMTYSSEEGFGLTGCERKHFRRVEEP